LSLQGNLKEQTSIINPVITLQYDRPFIYNYCYIPEFERYYFIENVDIVRANLYRVYLSVDVLETYKTEILNQAVIVEKNENNYNNYLPDENWKTNVKTKTDIINFSNGFLENGEFILITAGG
jgi:hypothetical protein